MDDIKLIEAIERYYNGGMSPDERVRFELLRKSNPEVDQMVVEHTFFMQQYNRHDEAKSFKAKLNAIHVDLAEKGAIRSPKLQGRAKVVYLADKYRRTVGIAASIAGITALAVSIMLYTVSPKAPAAKEIAQLNRKFDELSRRNQELDKEIDRVKTKVAVPPVAYKTGGTGFLISTKGLLVTNAHVIKGARNIAVQNSEGVDLAVSVLHVDDARDLAILKITDTAFKAPAAIPYTISRSGAEIAEPVYTLGYPRNEIVYGEGYLSARTGFNGDTITCQIAIAANPGNSGGPILNKAGEVIGVLSTKQTSAEGVVFATQSKYIQDALEELKKDTAYAKMKLPASSTLKGLDRPQQVKKMEEMVYMVKVN